MGPIRPVPPDVESFIRIAISQLPATSYRNQRHTEAFILKVSNCLQNARADFTQKRPLPGPLKHVQFGDRFRLLSKKKDNFSSPNLSQKSVYVCFNQSRLS